MNKTIIITGATGTLGSAIMRTLLFTQEAGDVIYALDDTEVAKRMQLQPRDRNPLYIYDNLCKQKLGQFPNIDLTKPIVVYHCAGVEDHASCRQVWSKDNAHNRERIDSLKNCSHDIVWNYFYVDDTGAEATDFTHDLFKKQVMEYGQKEFIIVHRIPPIFGMFQKQCYIIPQILLYGSAPDLKAPVSLIYSDDLAKILILNDGAEIADMTCKITIPEIMQLVSMLRDQKEIKEISKEIQITQNGRAVASKNFYEHTCLNLLATMDHYDSFHMYYHTSTLP